MAANVNSANTTFLSGAQATQLIQRLRDQGHGGDASTHATGAIKIQAVQTNPQTGLRQIIAIPIQSGSANSASLANRSGFHVVQAVGSEGLARSMRNPHFWLDFF